MIDTLYIYPAYHPFHQLKLTNLTYTTSAESIANKLSNFGPVLNVELLMDKTSPGLSIGKAFVLFELLKDAEKCVEKINDKMIDGRAIKIVLVDTKKKRKSNKGNNGNNDSSLLNKSRYWDLDFSVKQIDDEDKTEVCPLCGKEGHDSWACPLSKICFNCGVPGHINRECIQRRGMPRRVVCGNCFQSGHHAWACRSQMYDIPNFNPTCFVCGGNGHFMCKQMKWFHGLDTVYCFNCGQEGHHGERCQRPNLDECLRNKEVGLREIERAETLVLQNHDEERRRRRRRDDDRENERRRAKSQPPKKFHHNQHIEDGRVFESERRRDSSTKKRKR